MRPILFILLLFYIVGMITWILKSTEKESLGERITSGIIKLKSKMEGQR